MWVMMIVMIQMFMRKDIAMIIIRINHILICLMVELFNHTSVKDIKVKTIKMPNALAIKGYKVNGRMHW